MVDMRAMARPAKPKLVNQDKARHFASVMGMAPEEIIDVKNKPAGEGVLVTTKDGHISEISQDDRYLGPYRPEHGSVNGTDEPWSLEDLDAAAEQLKVVISGRLSEQFLYADGGYAPVRAWAWWRAVAAGRHLSMAEAAIQNSDAAECRRIILASGWLTADDAAKL